MKTILVTGGAGFIGSHVVDALLKKGYEVKVLDNLEPQVHGTGQRLPDYWNPRAQFILGDVRSSKDWDRALHGVDAVIHLAAEVGVGQSMHEIGRYIEVNTLGTALLLEKLMNRQPRLQKLIVASSMSVYGEGAYRCKACGPITPDVRRIEQMRSRDWEVKCPQCHSALTPTSTPETKTLCPTSVYAIAKRDQEELCLVVGNAYGIPTVALRYFNVYGPRQALSNPYTGVVAIFSSRLLNKQSPWVFEDGLQSRDFIHVHDIAKATLRTLELSAVDGHVVNIGAGRSLSLLQMCDILKQLLGSDLAPTIVEKFREGDIRHCYADTTKAEKLLGFKADIPFEEGIRELAACFQGQKPLDRIEAATEELLKKGLLK